MIEKHIILEDIDPVVFYGVGNGHLQMIKSLYPKLRIVARDNVIRVLGDEEEMASFEENIEKMRRHVLKYNSIGEEDILDIKNQPVPSTKNPEENEYYRRTLNYIQVPILAHLAWGKESNGLNFFFNAGPQFGFLQSEKTETNFTPETANFQDRTNKVVAQDTMKVENKLDYGITAGIGAELHVKNIGRFQLEARYYYGLGNLYGDSKRDYFASSRSANITIRAAYLFDL